MPTEGTTPSVASPLPPFRKAIFALGDHTVNVALSSLSLVFFTFLVTVAGLEPWMAGVLAWLARLVDAVSDPVMGRISDHTTWRMGRRRPWFLIGMLPFSISFGALWATPFEGQAAMFAYYLAVYIAVCLATTVLSVPYLSLIPEMAVDYDERTSLNTWRSAAAIFGTMVAACFFTLVEWFGGGATGYWLTGLVLSAWLLWPWPLVVWSSFEAPVRGSEEPASFIDGIKSLSRHGTYIRLCLFFLLARISVDLLGLAVPLFFSINMGRPTDVTWTLLSLLGMVIISLPFWLSVARRSEKHQVFTWGSVWTIVCLSTIWFAEPDWPRGLVFAIAGLMGIGYAVVDLMPWAMLGEVIDEDELITGERREGVYNGIFTFIRKAGGATAYMVAGVALSLSGFDRTGGEQPEAALTTIRVTTCIAPSVFLLAALVVARRYPLGRARHLEILDALGRGRASEATDRL
jgi:GPH family glycoside/pentoside/hexuronide:cation symporter